MIAKACSTLRSRSDATVQTSVLSISLGRIVTANRWTCEGFHLLAELAIVARREGCASRNELTR